MSETTASTTLANGAGSQAKKTCEVCGVYPAVTAATLGKTRSGKAIVLRVCEACQPIEAVVQKSEPKPEQKRQRKKMKNRRPATDYSDMVLTILFRQAGGTADQVARWLLQLTDDFDHRETDSYRAALYAARTALRTMRETGQVEALSVRPEWSRGARSGKPGRRVDYYRLRPESDSIVEAAGLCGIDGVKAKKHYARPWMGGGHVHACHRADLQLLFVEEADHEEGVEVDAEKCTCETHERYPLIGAKLPTVDAAGEDLTALRKNAKRTYASVVPDAEIVVAWEDAEYVPDGGAPDDEYLDISEVPESDQGSYEEHYEETGEEVYA